MIKELTISYKAVSKYQTVELSATLSEFTEDEVAQVKDYLRNEAISQVNVLAEALGSDIEKKSNQQYVKPYQKPQNIVAPPAPAPRANVAATEKQISILKRAGYSDEQIASFDKNTVSNIIQQYFNNKN